jgi:hypothetical protein
MPHVTILPGSPSADHFAMADEQFDKEHGFGLKPRAGWRDQEPDGDTCYQPDGYRQCGAGNTCYTTGA